jgi:hypothetical protein
VEDGTHSVQLLTNYDCACAACHDEKIRTSVGQGIAMLTLPTLDVGAYRKAGLEVGSWPAGATGDFDGRLPPIMKLLLAGDAHTAAALTKLGANFEFADLDTGNVDQLRASAALVDGIRQLLVDLSQNGPEAARVRLQSALARDLTSAELQLLVAGLSIDTVRDAARAWFPNADVGAKGWQSMPSASETEPRTPNPGRPFAQAGAWSRDDATFAVRYLPSDHADPVLGGWLNLIGNTPTTDTQPLVAGAAKELMKPTAPGQCISCHSVDQTTADSLLVNWRPADLTAGSHTFTKFSHGPHLSLPQLADCTSCHALDSQASTAASYADYDPHHFASDFQPLSKQQCATCHTTAAAGDSCQSCHRYHVDRVEEWRIPHHATEFDGMAKELGTALK